MQGYFIPGSVQIGNYLVTDNEIAQPRLPPLTSYHLVLLSRIKKKKNQKYFNLIEISRLRVLTCPPFI